MLSRDDIIRMAREAGMQGMLTDVVTTVDELARFAALVAAAEREACAKVCEELRDDWLRGRGRYEFMGEGADYCSDAIRAQAADRLARHGIQLPDENEEYGNPSF